MISKIKGIMETTEKLNEINAKVDDNTSIVCNHSKELNIFKNELMGLKTEVKTFVSEASRFSETAFSQLAGIRKTNDDLKSEVFDFKSIKADIKSKLVGEIMDDFRSEMRSASDKLNTDVKHFNELKNELSSLVTQFKSVEDEISKFKLLATQVKEGDFQLQRHARELEKNDSEKLRLMQENDNLKRLLAKERRGRR